MRVPINPIKPKKIPIKCVRVPINQKKTIFWGLLLAGRVREGTKLDHERNQDINCECSETMPITVEL